MGSFENVGQVANPWNGLPTKILEVHTLAVFKRRLDVTLKEHEWKFNFKSDVSPIVNQSSKPITVTQAGMAAADDLDIEAYACIQYTYLHL